MTITLAIETSGRAGSIALRANGSLLADVQLAATGRRHARTLVPEIRDLLKSQGMGPHDVQLLAVSIGPGSFTGLRVGAVCAKTFAYAVGCPLIGVDTFLAVAAAQSEANRVWVIEDALRGDLFLGEYECRDGRWRNVTPPQLLPFEICREKLTPDVPVTGPGVDQWGEELESLQIPLITPPELRIPQARWIALLGEQLVEQGERSDPWTLEPFYMRRSAAEEKADSAGATS